MAEAADYFAVLGVPRRAVFSAEELRSAFRERGAAAHPDAGGDVAGFELVNLAYTVLGDPAARLRHLCELEFGAAPDAAGEIDAETMRLFDTVGAAVAATDAYLKRRAVAGSAIARALLAGGEVEVQRAVMAAGGAVRARREELLARLAGIDRALAGDREGAQAEIGECYRALGFLGKWGAQIGERMAALL